MFEPQITPRRCSALATITALVACVFAAGRLDAAVVVLWVPISPPTGISGTATIKAATPQRPLAAASTILSVQLADRRYEIDGTPLSSALIERDPAEKQLRPPLPPHDLLDDARLADTDPDTYQLSADEQYRFFLATFDQANESDQRTVRGIRLNEQPTVVEHPGTENAYRVISDFARRAADAGSFHLIATVNTVHEFARAELEWLFAAADQWSRASATVDVEDGNPNGNTNANYSHTTLDKSRVDDQPVPDAKITNNLDAVDDILSANANASNDFVYEEDDHIDNVVTDVSNGYREDIARDKAVIDNGNREALDLGQYNADSPVNAESTIEVVPAHNKKSDVTTATRDTSGTLAAPILSGTADALKSVSAWLSDVSDSITARAEP